MRPTPLVGLVRVTHSRDVVEEATRVGLEKKREGYSPEALVLAVDEILGDMPLSRAIVVYIQSVSSGEDDTSVERPFSWFTGAMSLAFAGFCLWLVYLLFRLVGPDTHFFAALGIVILQSLLLRLTKRSLRLTTFSAVDGANDASYPTNLHPIRNAPAAVGSLRLRRLRQLLVDTADRITAGEKPADIESDLSDVNLTPRAAKVIVRLARISAAVRDYVPPYESRWLGLTLAVVFVGTCIIVIERAGDALAEGYQLYAIAVSAWVGGDLAARPRRPRSPSA